MNLVLKARQKFLLRELIHFLTIQSFSSLHKPIFMNDRLDTIVRTMFDHMNDREKDRVTRFVCNDSLLAFFMVASLCAIIIKVSFSEAKLSIAPWTYASDSASNALKYS